MSRVIVNKEALITEIQERIKTIDDHLLATLASSVFNVSLSPLSGSSGMRFLGSTDRIKYRNELQPYHLDRTEVDSVSEEVMLRLRTLATDVPGDPFKKAALVRNASMMLRKEFKITMSDEGILKLLQFVFP